MMCVPVVYLEFAVVGLGVALCSILAGAAFEWTWRRIKSATHGGNFNRSGETDV